MSFTSVAPNVRYVEVLHGDTLKRIALRELGDASLWLDVALLNGLRPPYVAEDSALGVAGYGDSIKVPAPFSAVSASTSPVEVFQSDIEVTDKRLQAEAGDIKLVSGVPNFVQAVRHHVVVEKRELAFHPTFGCWVRSLIGTGNNGRSGQLAAFYVRSAIIEDRRVDSVESCTATIIGDQIQVVARVIPISGRPVDIQVVI